MRIPDLLRGDFCRHLCCVLAVGVLHGCARPSPVNVAIVASLAGDEPPALTCVESWPEARYRNFGYDHIVHLLSRCAEVADCQVSTNVNPQVISTTVKPTEHVEVLTFRGSPASAFTPSVRCWAPKGEG